MKTLISIKKTVLAMASTSNASPVDGGCMARPRCEPTLQVNSPEQAGVPVLGFTRDVLGGSLEAGGSLAGSRDGIISGYLQFSFSDFAPPFNIAISAR